ncbi:MAG: hypothetical protein R3F60_28190 [bacterium]
MKTKAYKLAADLGVAEPVLLDWLRTNGYPNARRGDTIRAEVAVAARRALGRGGQTGAFDRIPPPRPTGSPVERLSGVVERPSGVVRPPDRPTDVTEPPRRASRASEGFRVSFADLLEEHLPAGLSEGLAAAPTSSQATMAAQRPQPRPSARPSTGLSGEDILKLRLQRMEADRDQVHRELDILRQRLEAEQVRLREALAALAAADADRHALVVLRQEHERVLLERATQRQALQAAADERGTLEQTCAELQQELRDVRDQLAGADAEREVREATIADLESAVQREVAWRARALELERVVQMGNSLHGLLQGLGLDDVRLQADVLRALLADREGALGLIRAIRQVDAAALTKMISGRVARICAHPLCDEIARLDDRLRVRVDDAARCEVCQDSADRRWFARLVRECARAGVRRLLVIGGTDATQRVLRELSQGQPLDLRLVADAEPAPAARVRGRVEGCDVLVLWSATLVDEAQSAPYATAAEAEGRPVVRVLGDRGTVAGLARAVSIRLARNHILAAH